MNKRAVTLVVLAALAGLGATLLVRGPEAPPSLPEAEATRDPRPVTGSLLVRESAPHDPSSSARPADQSCLAYRFVPGDVRTYRLDYEQAMRLAVDPSRMGLEGEARTGENAFVASARLGLSVLDVQRDSVWIAARLDQLAIAPRGPMASVAPPALITPAIETLVRLDLLGEVEGFVFPRGLEPSATALFLGLVLPFQVVLPDESGFAWTTVEEDALGRFRADYRASVRAGESGYDIEKRIAAYDEVAAAGGRSSATAGFHGTSWFDPAKGELRHVTIEAASKIRGVEIAHEIETRTRGTLALAESGTDGLEPHEREIRLARARAAGDFETVATSRRLEALARQNDCDEATARLEGVSLETLLAVFAERETRKGPMDRAESDAFRLMALLFRSDSRAVDQALEILRSGIAGVRAASAVASALGAAGSARAESALVELAGASAIPARLRLESVVALGGSSHAAPSSEWFLRETSEDSSADPDLASASLLALGRMGAAVESQDSERALAIASFLDARLAHAATPGERCEALAAIGNAGIEANLDRVISSVHAGEEAVRESAVRALARMDGERARSELRRAASSDPSARVREAATRALEG